jgi:malate dehydrogenase (oxaloacetate-decarboxylating)(NADP+)
MREARRLVLERVPGLEVDGEMHGDAALSEAIRSRVHPDSTLKGEANLLIMPNLDAANISFNLLKITGGEGVTIGPILLGACKPVLIATPSATVRRLVNLTALAGVGAPPAAIERRCASVTATARSSEADRLEDHERDGD